MLLYVKAFNDRCFNINFYLTLRLIIPLISCRVFLYDEFLSEQECDGLMKAHDSHVKESSKINPLICFDTIETLRKHLKAAHKRVKVTPNDFIPGQSNLMSIFLRNWNY